MPTILVVDDDPKIRDMLRRTLAYEGYAVVTADDGEAALAQARVSRPDLVVLDWLMPRRSGIEVAQLLRGPDAPPILMLTARDTLDDRVAGLDSGADDYLVKPFAARELLARVRALLRRAPAPSSRPLEFADLELDPAARSARRGERAFELTPTEWDLLTQLLRHPRQVLTREQLIAATWGEDFNGNSTILDVYIGYLRAKTEAAGEPRLIHTVRGVGYVLRDDAR
jgi:two-component system response regulator MprA